MKTKEMKGITLVALVVTIVVLLILAGVSINTVLGDDGIIKKAKEAAETTKRVSAEEEMNRLVLEYQLASKDETLESFLQEKVTEGRIDGVTDNGDGTITITKKVEGKDYTITVKKPVAPTPSVKVGAIRVVSDSTGAGSSLGEASTRKGTTLYIMIESTISGGTTSVSPEVPYAVTENGTYKFTVTGTVNGTAYTKEVSVEVNQFKDTYEYMDKNTEVTYPDGKVWVPEGFRIADDSSDNIQGGVVIEDKDGNQFVWVPVDTIDNYKRTCYRNNSLYRYEQCSEDLPEDEKTSVEKYKGFYIGRYEAGDKDSTEASTPALRTSSSSTSNKISIKANQAPYNYVTRTQAVSLAEGFATKQGYKAKTKLVSSYAWDTTIAFMQKVNSDYGSSSEEGNYKDTTFSYTDITGARQTKAKNSNVLVPTGQTTPVCNIYDMGGNVFEWTTESCSNTDYPYARRGGFYYYIFANIPAGFRDDGSDDADDGDGFRLTLFM